ncbi:hypothetical protein [Flavihumibacter petaseus]|uniref:Uncharacterized protein n=1 Tax=Flavihumibacter petaseus NBRC 106054 TaxID=1220578 RepID=A0A0E9MXH5_9BACT|nr:hypothetical protein [Flavihumibacter petaseus]GAO42208.1 hypothetical protein FPE01S_01_12210 [Flavihumibacter petaseus NBRC 106054]
MKSAATSLILKWTALVAVGIGAGTFLAFHPLKPADTSPYTRESSTEILKNKDSLLSCGKEGLNTAAMLAGRKDSVPPASPLPRKPHD